MPFQSEAVANKFVELSKRKPKQDPLTLMKLLKVAYFAHGWHLAISETPLLNTQVEAWKFGPVVPSIYHAFKSNGSHPITELCQTISEDSDLLDLVFTEPVIPSDSGLEPFFEKIWDVYGSMSAFQLSQLTHQSDTPWYKAWFENGGKILRGVGIPDAEIQAYFKKKMAA